MEILYGILIIIAILGIYIISIYNKFIQVKNKVEEALSGIDVALARRYATLTNTVEVVKGYVKHEKEVLLKLVELRQNPTMKDRVMVDENQSQAITQLFALQESYPELKANQQFLALQDTIRDLEEHLAASRRMYNSNVSIYNNLVLSFPSNLIGNMMNAQKQEYFQATGEERKNVQVNL